MENNADIRLLFRKYLAGECTIEEVETLYAHFGLDSNDPNLHTILTQYFEEAEAHDAEALQRAKRVADDALPHVEAAINRQTRALSRPRPLIRYLVAAVLLVSVSIGIGLYLRNRSDAPAVALTSQYGEDALPGGNRATLTLADGRTITLDEAQTGITVSDEDITYDDGSSLGAVMVSGVEPSLQNSRDPSHAQSLPRLVGGDASVMLALTTPKGGTYQVTLPDGSKVWLNSASTLKYPSRFTGDTREVILEGEAYFEIKKIQGTRDTRAPASNSNADGARVSRVPFKVRTSGQTVEVLGTEFNISAYQDNPETKTTLVEGKVKVTPGTQKGNAQDRTSLPAGRQGGLPDYILSPGQQSVISKAGIQIESADIDSELAWKNNQFIFREETLESIMRKLARWYGVDVVFNNEKRKQARFEGIMTRFTNISEVLRMLELAGDVQFDIANNTVTVY